MHKNNEYVFTTEVEAQDFANRYLGPNGRPERDTYVTGPLYCDDAVTFKNMAWVECRPPYWSVTIETYS